MPPLTDELLSSWLCRHASFYAVPPLVMLQHCLPEVTSLRAADLDLSAAQASRLANALSIEPSAVRAMTFATVNKTSRRLIGAKPLQSCLHCGPALSDCRPILRSQLLGWRVTCPLCGELLSDPDGSRSRFSVPQISASCASWRATARCRSGAWQMDLGLTGRYCSLASDASRAKASARRRRVLAFQSARRNHSGAR